jgi:hypothetical protein
MKATKISMDGPWISGHSIHIHGWTSKLPSISIQVDGYPWMVDFHPSIPSSGWADGVDFVDKPVTVEPSVSDSDIGHALVGPRKPKNEDILAHLRYKRALVVLGMGRFGLSLSNRNKLVIAVGMYSQTFDTKGLRACLLSPGHR